MQLMQREPLPCNTYMVRFALRGSAVVQKMPAQYDGDEIVRGGVVYPPFE